MDSEFSYCSSFCIVGVENAIEDLDGRAPMGGRKVSVPKSHFDIFLTEKLLDGRKVLPGHDKMRWEGVSESLPSSCRWSMR